MHIAQQDKIHSGNEDNGVIRTELHERHTEDDGLDTDADGSGPDNDECNEADEYGEDDEHGLLQCPFNGCERTDSFKDRSNLIRHFQQRMWFYESFVGYFAEKC
jgi:hypothetical protein